MSHILSMISSAFLPALLAIILIYGFVKKAPVYDLFIEGCREGLSSAANITPYIIAIFLAITLMTDSGALSALEKLVAPVFNILGLPQELLSFMIMRPVSGSGTLVLVEQLAENFGADSFVCRCASTMMGSSETLLYAIAVYFGVTSVKHLRHTVAVGIAGYIIGIWASFLLCKVM
ncbi:MAG: spore maturation protein [Firmicutes bacterium]|nr:spore maturation protein [Bacillota bacterium]